MAFMDINLLGDAFTDYPLLNVGASAFELEHDWFIQQDLVIRTASGGGGTLLIEDTDYTLSTESSELSNRVTASVGSARNVFHEITIINATYQSGDLYFSGKYVADTNSAEDINTLITAVATKVPTTRQVLAGTGLSGGGDLSADRTLTLAIPSYDTGWINRSDWTNVHLGSNTTKNADSNVAHNLNALLSNLLVKVLISTDGTDANSFEMAAYWAYVTASDSRYGFTIYNIDNNNIKVQTGTHGISYLADDGTSVVIDTEDWYYKVKVWYLG